LIERLIKQGDVLKCAGGFTVERILQIYLNTIKCSLNKERHGRVCWKFGRRDGNHYGTSEDSHCPFVTADTSYIATKQTVSLLQRLQPTKRKECKCSSMESNAQTNKKVMKMKDIACIRPMMGLFLSIL
jgi:hypothetical protein